MLNNLIFVSTINIDEHIAAILKVTADERRWSHILQCNDLYIGIPKLYLWNVPEHKVSVRQKEGF